jgi:tetratricopeptide (TPR) repeat protein
MATRCYNDRKSQRRIIDKKWEEDETRHLASRVSVIGRDDALALCWAGHGLATVCREYDAGAAMIDQALVLNSNLAAAWHLRASVGTYVGQYDSAREQVARALRLSPIGPDVLLYELALANIDLFQGRYGDASKLTARALARQPNAMIAMRAFVTTSAHAGKLEEARKVLARMRELDPGLRICHIKEFLPFDRPQDIERFVEGLRLAGLPE